ncbi:MAG TPA: glycogen debranching enzyme GlgX, partial [Planctomycetota bacterium]|nr:glycogen debranching enzyme GlgX [Planctomycetota bacterium]
LWIKPDGLEMSEEEWGHAHARSLGTYLAGAGLEEVGRRGRPISDDDFLILFNAHHEDIEFVIPSIPGDPWLGLLDTWFPTGSGDRAHWRPGLRYLLRGRSLALFTRVAAQP